MAEERSAGGRSAARRRIGDFGGFADDGGLADHVRSLLAEHPIGLWALYIRRSKATSEEEHDTANYLVRQEMLFDRLVELEIPKERILLLDGDTGQSGALTRRERADMAVLFDALDAPTPAERVIVLVSIEISRLHRTASLVEPAQFASRMSRRGTRVLTTGDKGWVVLQMEDDADADLYLNAAKHAAKERNVTRLRTLHARETAVEQGAWSGSPTSLGWRGEAKKSKWETPDGRERRAMQYAYEPHRTVKLEIMRASLLPHLKTITQLRNYMLLDKERYTFPPFHPAVRGEAFRNSILPRTRVPDPTFPGGSRPPRPDEPYFPGLRAIENILLDTQAIGDVRFGTGERTGSHKLRKAERRAEQDDSKVDSLIRDYRPLARRDPTLAICRTPEEIALYHAVVKKWSKVDLIAASATGYQDAPINEERTPKLRGRPSGAGITASPWAGKLYCYRHGVDADTGDFVRYRRFWRQGKSYTCSQDKKTFGGKVVCAQLPYIEETLTRHLLRTISHLLYNTDGMLDRLQAERDAAKRRAEQLDTELADLEARRRKMMATLTAMVAALDGSDDAAVQSVTEEFSVAHIKPLVSAIAANKREAAAAREASLHAPRTDSADEIKAELRRAVADWESYTPDRRRELVATFVDWIGVLIPDGTGTVIIEWQWSPRAILTASGEPMRDILITWRSRTCDNRPWTTEEDDALRRLWPAASGADRDDILAALMPGRNFSGIQRRTTALNIKGANRPTEWRQAWCQWERTYGEDNPDAMYAHILNWNRGAAALVRQVARDWEERRFGPEGDWHNGIRCGLVRQSDPVGGREKASELDYTSEEIDREMHGESADYQVRSMNGDTAHTFAHLYLPILLPEQDREGIARLSHFSRWEADELRRASHDRDSESHLYKNDVLLRRRGRFLATPAGSPANPPRWWTRQSSYNRDRAY